MSVVEIKVIVLPGIIAETSAPKSNNTLAPEFHRKDLISPGTVPLFSGENSLKILPPSVESLNVYSN